MPLLCMFPSIGLKHLQHKSLGIGLESFQISRLVVVLVLTEILDQDKYWYWSKKSVNFKTSLVIGLDRNLKSYIRPMQRALT